MISHCTCYCRKAPGHLHDSAGVSAILFVCSFAEQTTGPAAVPLRFQVTPLVIRQQQGPPGFSVAIAIADLTLRFQASDESRPSDLSEPLETTTAAMFSYIIFALVGSLVAAAIDLSAVEDLPTPSLVAGQVAHSLLRPPSSLPRLRCFARVYRQGFWSLAAHPAQAHERPSPPAPAAL